MKNQNEFIIENNDLSNIDELIKLSKTYYKDGDIINKEYLQWQYLGNPNGKPFLFTSKEKSDNDLAGQYLVIPIKFSLNNKTILGSLSLNTLTDPKYQGKGLFTKMANATYEACSKENAFFTIGFPNPQSYPGFVKKLDFQHLGDIPLLIKPLKYFNILSSYFKKNKKKHAGAIELKKIIDPQIKKLDISKDKVKMNEFWDSISSQYILTTSKSFEFIKWRYFDIPTRNYQVFSLEEDSKIKGLVILKAENVWGYRVGIIMDILLLNNDYQVSHKLLKYVDKVCRLNNLDFIAALHSSSYEYSLIKKSGYYILPQKLLPQKIHYIVRINKDFQDSELLFNLKNWKLTFGDYDIF